MAHLSTNTFTPRKMSKICAWCGKVIAVSYVGGGHGICDGCLAKVEKQARDDGYIGKGQQIRGGLGFRS